MITNPPYHETINKLLYAILQHFEGNPIPMNVPRPPYYNITNDLLYAILNRLNGDPVVFTGIRVLYVSSRYGSDVTAEVNNISKPFKTITAAKNNYFFGDIIRVMEGTYDEGSLSGNYFYFFDFGSEVVYSGATGAIFNQWFGQCIVRGYGKFRCTGNANVINVGNWFNCILDIEAESFESVLKTIVVWQNRPIGDPTFFKPHRIRAKRAYSSTHTVIHYHFNVHADIAIDEVVTDSLDQPVVRGNNIKKAILHKSKIFANNFEGILLDANGGETRIEDCEIHCNWDSPQGHCLIGRAWGSDMVVIYRTKFFCKNADAKSIYTDVYLNIKLDTNVMANRDTGGPFPITYLNKGVKINLENNEATLDITGLSSIDLTNFNNADIIRLTSVNATETINEIIAAPKHHSYKLAPGNGLALTITSTDPLLATDTSIVLESASLILDGSKGDWIELYNGVHGIGNRQLNASTY